MALADVGLLALGAPLLALGAWGVVEGGSAIGFRLGMSPLTVGLTVVAVGTSSPELAVSLAASWAGSPDVVMGNVVGSNILNILVVLGLAAVVRPIVVQHTTLRRDFPLVVGASILVWAMAANALIGRLEGILLLAGAVLYLWRLYHARSDGWVPEHEPSAPAVDARSMLTSAVLLVGGLILLWLGSTLLVDGAVSLATALGVSERVISVSLVAIGTSLPEVATSVVAAVKGQTDLAVGNVVGSNLFNLLLVLGASAAVAPINVSPGLLRVDIPFMVVVAVVLVPLARGGFRISRFEGWMLLTGYAMYAALLLATA